MSAELAVPSEGGAHDDAARAAFRADVLAGLSATPKRLAAKYFYDARGSELFEEITRVPEYYPTRTEIAILERHAAELGGLVPPGAALVEFGSGSARKIRILLSALPGLAAYVPVDVSADFLADEARRLAADFPRLAVEPVVADFTRAFALPPRAAHRPLVGFFPGSTIGNFEPPDAEALLGRFADLLGPGSSLIVGVDLIKPKAILDAAYDDSAGVTAAFNLNLLVRINRELDGDFDTRSFEHRAFFDPDLGRVEMHLVSRREQIVRVAGETFAFGAGEAIHTENSYKYTPAGFGELAAKAGWSRTATFTDPDRLFAVFALGRS